LEAGPLIEVGDFRPIAVCLQVFGTIRGSMPISSHRVTPNKIPCRYIMEPFVLILNIDALVKQTNCFIVVSGNLFHFCPKEEVKDTIRKFLKCSLRNLLNIVKVY